MLLATLLTWALLSPMKGADFPVHIRWRQFTHAPDSCFSYDALFISQGALHLFQVALGQAIADLVDHPIMVVRFV